MWSAAFASQRLGLLTLRPGITPGRFEPAAASSSSSLSSYSTPSAFAFAAFSARSAAAASLSASFAAASCR